MKTRLSICIVVYNDYNDATKAISTIEEYTSIDISKKIYIVDNGTNISKENETKDFISFISKYKDIEYINTNSNLGFGKGHNQVLDLIDSDYHAIVNPDIILCEDSFSKIINWMNNNNDVGMVIPKIVDESGNIQEVYRKELTLFDVFNRRILKGLFKKRYNNHVMKNMDYTKPFQVPFGQGSFLVIRTKLFKELKGFDENYFMYVEDADLCKRVNQTSKLVYYPETRVIHKWKKESQKDSKLFKYHFQSMEYYFKKWGLKVF